MKHLFKALKIPLLILRWVLDITGALSVLVALFLWLVKVTIIDPDNKFAERSR